MFESFNRLFPLWAVLFTLFAVYDPAPLLSIKFAVNPLLMLIMFLMGVTLSRQDFAGIFRQPKALFLGLVLHYTVMPLAAFAIGHLLRLPTELMMGVLLVGSVASGTASNVMTWISGGNVALAVSLAIVSTVISVVVTPLLIWLMAGQGVHVPVVPMLWNIAEIVLLPIVAGVIVHQFIAAYIKRIEPMLASMAVLAILFIIGVIVSANAGQLAQLGPIVAIAVVLHNGVGLLGGFWGGRLLGLDQRQCRALAFEVGMQNSALASTLGATFFSPLSALPGAVFSVWHNISGSLLAAYWKRHPVKEGKRLDKEKHR